MVQNNLILGIDIGGQHITCSLVNLDTGSVIDETRVMSSVNPNAYANDILKIWCDSILMSCSYGLKPEGLGVAMPGPFDYENGISKIKGVGKYDALYDLNIKEIFSSVSGLPPDRIKFMNDASCFALGEYHAGAGVKSDRMIAVTLGTGFGSTFISGGQIITEGKGVPHGGMFWDVPYKTGIADDYFSTRWFVESYYKLSEGKVGGVYEIARLYDSDKFAKILFDEFASAFAEFLMPYFKDFNPDVFVVGGNIAHASGLFFPKLIEECKINNINVKIALSELWEDAALIGSGFLFK